MPPSHEEVGKELSSKLSDIDSAYLADLFDGEGCINATLSPKKYFSKKEQREKIRLHPKVQFTISSKDYLLLELVKTIIGLGDAPKRKIYRDKRSKTYKFQISGKEQVLSVVNALLRFVRLKKESLELSREALLYLFQRKPRSKWTKEELIFFRKEFILPLQKLLPSGEKCGRPPKYDFDEIISLFYT